MRKKNHIILFLLIIAFSIAIQSCKKKEEPEPPHVIFGNLRTTIEKDSLSNIYYEDADADFRDSNNSYAVLVPALVKVNGALLDNNYNGTSNMSSKYWYSNFPFDCSQHLVWDNSGSSAVPAFTCTNSKAVPYIDASYISIDTITIANGLTISHPYIDASQVDYRIYNKYDDFSTSFCWSRLGSSSGMTFTADQFQQHGFYPGIMGAIRINVICGEYYNPQPNLKLTLVNQCAVTKRVYIK